MFLEEICSKLIYNCSQAKDIDCIKRLHDEFSCRCPSSICNYGRFRFLFCFVSLETQILI